MDDPQQVEIVRKALGECILLQEKLAYKLHNSQRMAIIDRAPFHDKIASIMRTMNRELSVVDTDRDMAIAVHTQDVLRNSRVKSELAIFLVLQSQLQRLSSLIEMGGAVDGKLTDPGIIDDMNVNQLLVAQKSFHNQMIEIMEFVRDVKTDSLEGLIKSISPEGNREIRETVSAIASLAPSEREKVSILLRKLMNQANKEAVTETTAEVVPVEPTKP
jgi:hypothetical protein